MKIDSIRIVRVAMPLIYPFRTAFGDDEVIESVLVRLSSGDHYGWGESASWKAPAYCPECAATQFVISRDFLAPRLLNQEIPSGQALQDQLAGIKGNHFAKAAFDLAWWDLHAKQQSQPLWRILGGKGPVVTAGADFGVMDSIPQLIESISRANEQGYKRVKLKYRPGWELNMIKQVRAAFPDTVLHVDCNSGYSLSDLEMFEELDNYGLAMIEQPLAHNDLVDHAALQSHLKTPICLDESIVSADRARKAIQLGACRWINIKLGRVGGITNALKINSVCEENGIPCWVGGMLESAVGGSHNIAFATLANMQYPCDIFPTSRFYVQDLGTPPIEHSAPSEFEASEEPGIGVCPNEQLLEELAIEQTVVA
jgi:o-succinylbenzoate synthase